MADTFIGQQIDGYRVLEELGRGGMGVVYKAEDEALARPVALKMIARDLARDASFERRFKAEARALARINSPHITGIYALHLAEPVFIAMEYIAGGTLGDRLERGPLAWAEARPLVLDMVAALEHAHGVGIIHRDIKPGNILLTDAGQVKITDFGLAKLRSADGNATVTQGITGTLNYMSPEQVKGAPTLDGRSDLFSLGVTVYEMLTGRLPFARGGSEFATMRAIVEESFPPPSQFAPGLPPALDAAVMEALAKDPEARYPNAAAMRAAFAAVPAEGLTPVGRRDAPTLVEEPPYDAPPPLAMRPGWWAGALALVAAVLVAAALVAAAVWLWPSGEGVALSVASEPAGAVVRLGGERIGRTPLERTVPSESARLRVEHIGYASVDTLLSFRDAVALQVALTPLAEAAAQARLLEITSTPSPAAVLVNGERVGETPLTWRDTTGAPLAVRVERPGYRPWQQTGLVPQPDVTTTLRADLEPADRAETPRAQTPEQTPAEPTETVPNRAPGTLTVHVEPGSGSVLVDGQREAGGGSFRLAPGRHRVRCEHPEHGPYTETVEVRSGQRTQATCYFETVVRVQVVRADGVGEGYGTIWVNGANTSLYAPRELRFGPGTYRVEVRNPDFRVTPGSQEVTLRAGLVRPDIKRLIFELEEP